MSAVMIGERNRQEFREANAALANRVWDKLVRAGAVNFSEAPVEEREDDEKELKVLNPMR